MPDIGYDDEWQVVSKAMDIVSSGVPFILISLPVRGQVKVCSAGGVNSLENIKDVLQKVIQEIDSAQPETIDRG